MDDPEAVVAPVEVPPCSSFVMPFEGQLNMLIFVAANCELPPAAPPVAVVSQ